MEKIRNDSVLRIWCSEAINNPDARMPYTRDAEILQIEHAHDDDYIVEILLKEKQREVQNGN